MNNNKRQQQPHHHEGRINKKKARKEPAPQGKSVGGGFCEQIPLSLQRLVFLRGVQKGEESKSGCRNQLCTLLLVVGFIMVLLWMPVL